MIFTQWSSLILFAGTAIILWSGKHWKYLDFGFHAILFVSKMQHFVNRRILSVGLVKRVITSVQNLFLSSITKIRNSQVVDVDDRFFDFLIYTFRDEWTINRAVFYKENPYTENVSYPICCFTFITFDLVFGVDERYSINLSHPYNYYVVGNRLGSAFLLYLLKMQHGVTKSKDDMFVIEFYDPSVNLKYVTEEDEIILEKDSYRIENIPSESTKEDTKEDDDYFILPK